MSSEKVNKCWSTHQLTDSYISTVAVIKPNNITQDSSIEQASLHLGLSYRECLFCHIGSAYFVGHKSLQNWNIGAYCQGFLFFFVAYHQKQEIHLGAVEDCLGAFHLLLRLVQGLLVVPER